MRLAFLGTPDFAQIPLRALIEAGHDVVHVITQGDKRRGRGGTSTPSPVKLVAEELSIPVSDRMADLESVDFDIAVVAAFGRIIPERLIEQFTFLNLHPSLLPRWRGAAPVDHTILAGDERTGVCIIRLVNEMDAGPIFRTVETDVEPGEHANALLPRLFRLGSDALVELLQGPLPEPISQVGEPTYAGKFSSDDTLLDWTKPATELDRVVRTDRAWTTFRGKRLLVLDSRPVQAEITTGRLEGALVGAGKGALELIEVRPEGKGAMDARAWVNGARIEPGERLG